MKRLGDTEKVVSRNLKVCHTKNVTAPTTNDNSLFPSIKWYENSCLIFIGSCLKQKSATFTPPNIINFFIVYELDTWSQNLNFDFTLKIAYLEVLS